MQSPARAELIQERVLGTAAKLGPAEVFLRRTVAVGAEFENRRIVAMDEIARHALALRVQVDGRVGFASSSLPEDDSEIEGLIGRAHHATKYGPWAETILAPLNSSAQNTPPNAFESGNDLTPLKLDELMTSIEQAAPQAFLWSGRVESVSSATRIIHTGGLDVAGGRSAFKLKLRGRRAAASPIDRILNFVSPLWGDIVSAVNARIAAEFPIEDSITTPPPGVSTAIGPALLSRICSAMLSNTHLMPKEPPPNRIIFADVPGGGHFGCDDEGLSLRPVTIAENGHWGSRWRMVTDAGNCTPTGRAIRSSTDSPPQLAPLGLRYNHTNQVARHNQSVLLLADLAGMTIRPDGRLVGTASESIHLEAEQPVRRCGPQSIGFQIEELFGPRFANSSSAVFLSGPHMLPWILIN